QLRALSRRRGQGDPGARPSGRDRRSLDDSLPSDRALARFHDLLRHHRHRRWHRGPQEVRDPGRRRGLQEAPDRRRPLQVREPQARRGGRGRGLHRLLAPRAQREAFRHEERPRRNDPGGDAEERGGGHRVRARRRGRPEGEAGGAAAAGAVQARVDLLDRVRRPVGSQVAVARPAAPAGGKTRPESPGQPRRRGSRLEAAWPRCADQWDPKSPWHDRRLRLAVNHALNRQAINEVSCLGYCPPAGVIVPRVMEFALQALPLPYDPQKAKQLLAEAGYPNGIDVGDFVPTPPFVTTAEAATNYLGAVGIRTKMRLMERAAFLAAWREKKLRGLFMAAVGNSGNAASRVEAFMYTKGSNAYGGYPDLDDLFHQQARERDYARREAVLHRIQQLSIDRAMFAPIMDYRTLRGVGPRIAEHMLDSMHLIPFPAYEEVRLKGQ